MLATGAAFARGNHRVSEIAICGAGVGGLMLAARLAQMGRKPILFEARSETATTSEGVFLTLASNGMNGLRTIGCYEAVRASGIATTGIEIRNAKGKRLAFAAQSDHEAGFGAPSVTVRRGRLAEILLAKARAAGVDTRFDAQVSDVTTSPDGVGVRLQFKDGITHDFGILVAADGLGSTVHNVVFQGYPKPHFTGLIGTGGITNAPVPDTGGIMRMTFGNNAFFGYLKAEGQPVYWFNSYTGRAGENGKVTDPVGYAKEILALHADDPIPNAIILEHVDRVERSYPVYDMPKLPCWHDGRVVLIGDAAHAVGPHAGQGASMAIEDALVLAASLDAEQSSEAAFRRFEKLRRERIDQVVKLTARNSSQKRASGRLSLLIRDLVLPFLIQHGNKMGRKLCQCRVDLKPLEQT
ncbi:MAG: FAD-dependent monooxygenase [Alphaproteobacteria bacterium]|nr:MAG: FAD-dependent monooxygenase [Alphaproteobacteria bacterium]